MSNAKRFLSVILAIIMVCSTLVIGANAAYTAYKDAAITRFDALDKPILSTDQYASAAMDEVDRMLDEEQLKFKRDEIIVGDIDLTSLDAAMDSIYAIYDGTLFKSLSGMLGDLKNLNCEAFKPESKGGVRRTTSGKTDTDIIYAVLQFLNDNRGILTGFVAGTLDLGSIVASLIDISEFADVNVLLKGLLYEATYVDENGDSLDKPDDTAAIRALSFDTMVQDLIDRFVVDELTIDDVYIGEFFEGKTNISTGSMYNFLDTALKICYNKILVPLLNGDAKKGIREVCGVEYIDNGDGTVTEDESNVNAYAQLLNIDYVVPEFNFTSATLISQLNKVIKSIGDVMVNPAVFVWQDGDNTKVHDNIVALGKAALVNTGDDFFASYIDVASPEEVNAMTDQQLAAYALRAIINASVDGMYIPEEADSIREFGYYTLTQLLATSVPSLDFSTLPKDSTETLIVMGIDYAIYSINANLDMGLEYIYDMDGVDAQLAQAAQYGIDNYGGLLNGIANLNQITSGWELLDTILFHIIDSTWIPASTTRESGEFIFEDFLIDGLINNILDLDFDGLLDLFKYRSDSELQSTPKQVVINRVVSIINTIFPGAMQYVTSIDALASNSALSVTLGKIIDTLWGYKENLVASILPTLCMILDLTNEQEFEFPELTYNKMEYTNGFFDFDIKIRNGSTGINTAYSTFDANGNRLSQNLDQLYTYEIVSIEKNISTITIDAQPSSLPAGKSDVITIGGSISTTTAPLKLTISYNVKTENGTNLTSSPLVEEIYIMLTKTQSDDETTVSTTAAGGFYVSEVPTNIYATSMSDVTGTVMTVKNTNTTPVALYPVSDLQSGGKKTGKPFLDASNVSWIELNNAEPVNIFQTVGDSIGSGRITPFKTTAAWNALTREEKDAKWAEIMDTMMTKRTSGSVTTITSYANCKGYTLGVTDGTNTSQRVQSFNLFLYNDYNLPSIVNSELTKHRQPSSYEGGAEGTAWTAYTAALEVAFNAVYTPFSATNFAGTSGKASKYQAAAETLTAAIEALDEAALSSGTDDLQAIIDANNPSNEGLGYDDPAYVYFKVADFVDYTYYNYRDEYKSAQKLIDRSKTIDEATGEFYVINELDKVYAQHRLELYAGRLALKTPTKIHLAAELAQLTRSDVYTRQSEWSAESWAGFERALAFATAVNNDTTVNKQSKVNSAYNELLEAEKRLVPDEGETPVEPGDADYEVIEDLTVLDTESSDVYVLTGMEPGFDAEECFAYEGCTVVATENEAGTMSTGATIEIIDDATGNVLATYIVAIMGDINGDDDVSSDDVLLSLGIYGSTAAVTAEQVIAADTDADDEATSDDVLNELGLYGSTKSCDYINRVVV